MWSCIPRSDFLPLINPPNRRSMTIFPFTEVTRLIKTLVSFTYADLTTILIPVVCILSVTISPTLLILLLVRNFICCRSNFIHQKWFHCRSMDMAASLILQCFQSMQFCCRGSWKSTMATHPRGPHITGKCSDSPLGIGHPMLMFLNYFRTVNGCG